MLRVIDLASFSYSTMVLPEDDVSLRVFGNADCYRLAGVANGNQRAGGVKANP